MLSNQTISAQVHYSEALQQIFVGPDNVISYNQEVIQKHQQRIISAIEQVEILDHSEPNRIHQIESDSLKIQNESEKNSLKNILTAWQSITPNDIKLSSDHSTKKELIGSMVRLPYKSPRQYRTIRLSNGQVKTEEVKASNIKWRKCGGIDRNCLSADPNDCMTWRIEESRIIFVDSQGIAIPFDIIKKFYTQFRILDNEIECRVK